MHVCTCAQVQRHSCREWKCFSKCEPGEPKVCKYGYPRERCHHDLARSKITGRNIYRCEKKEDEQLSPYIPLWLLATGTLAECHVLQYIYSYSRHVAISQVRA